MQKKFTMIDEEFICCVCDLYVPKLSYTARNHCPRCLSSLHVDIFPGDRNSDCGGVLEPIGIEKAKKGYKIVYKCKKCNEIRRNIAAKDDTMDKIIELSSKPF